MSTQADAAEVRDSIEKVIFDKLGDDDRAYIKSNRIAGKTGYNIQKIGLVISQLELEGIEIEVWSGQAPYTWEVTRENHE